MKKSIKKEIIDNIMETKINSIDLHENVLSYLLYNGYSETIEKFCSEANLKSDKNLIFKKNDYLKKEEKNINNIYSPKKNSEFFFNNTKFFKDDFFEEIDEKIFGEINDNKKKFEFENNGKNKIDIEKFLINENEEKIIEFVKKKDEGKEYEKEKGCLLLL